LPDHSSLTRIRDRLGRDLFRRFFERVVERCQEAGLIWGEEVIFDATKVPANAALDSLPPRRRELTRAHIQALFAEEAAADDDEAPSPLPTTTTTPAGWQLLDECRWDPARPVTTTCHRQSGRTASRTDPDATPVRTGGGAIAVGSRDHGVVDGASAPRFQNQITPVAAGASITSWAGFSRRAGAPASSAIADSVPARLRPRRGR
jgi:hypothetical protein